MKPKKTNLFLAIDQSFEQEVIDNHIKFGNYTVDELAEIQAEAQNRYVANPEDFVIIEDEKARIPIIGVLYDRSDLFTWFYDLTTYEDISNQIDYALDKGVEEIIFSFDSPGGTISGLEKLAKKIKSLKIKTTSEVDYAASAAYLLASQTKKIVASGEWAETGSIGIIMSVLDFTEAYEKMGIKNLVFTSTKAPQKFLNPSTKTGAAQIQARLDQYHELLTNLISQGRKVTKEQIDDKFGKGSTLLAEDALKVKMIDAIKESDFMEESELINSNFKFKNSVAEEATEEENTMNEKDTPKVDMSFEKGMSAERKRVISLASWAKTGNAEQRKIALEAIESGKTQDEILASLMAAQRATDSEAKKEAANLVKENAPEIAVSEVNSDDKKEGEIKSLADSIVAELKKEV